jgi:hypothetical protein
VQASVRGSDRTIIQIGDGLGPLAGATIEDIDAATAEAIHAAMGRRNGGIVLSPQHVVSTLPVPQAILDAEATAVIAAQAQAEVHGILDTLRATPIDPAALDANLALLAAARGIPDPPAADIAALATFLPLAAPTAAQTAAAAKALIRVLANYADVVPAQRATINVLADTIRFMLQR